MGEDEPKSTVMHDVVDGSLKLHPAHKIAFDMNAHCPDIKIKNCTILLL